MSNIQTKTLFDGEHARVACEADGTPLQRPIYLRSFRNGCFVTVAEAEAIASELYDAAEAAKKAAR